MKHTKSYKAGLRQYDRVKCCIERTKQVEERANSFAHHWSLGGQIMSLSEEQLA